MLWMGTTGDDRKTGTAVSDIFHAMEGNDYLAGGGGNDVLSGMYGDDTVFGGSGDDFIALWQGDRATGGTGADIFSVVGGPFGFEVEGSIRAVVTDFKAAQGDMVQLTNFTFDWADRDADFTDGFALVQRGAHLLLRSRDQDGNVQEVLFLNTRRSQLTEENVTLIPAIEAPSRADKAPGLTWFGTEASERKAGTARDDHFQSMGGNDTLTGGGGNDLLHGGRGNDVVNGGAGHDELSMLGADRLTGGTGKDFFSMLGIPYNQMLGNQIRSVITDFKVGGPAANTDVLQFSGFGFTWADRDRDFTDGFSMVKQGRDVLIRTRDAGGNIQEVLVKNVTLRQLTEDNVQIIPAPFATQAPGQTWVGTAGNDRKVGTAGVDVFNGMLGNDTLIGNGGNDLLTGSLGNDVMNGGTGVDTLTFMGSDTMTGGSGADFFSTIGVPYNLMLGSNTSVITDFKATGRGHDFLQLFDFGVKWADRDADTGDGFSIARSGASDTLVTVRDAGGNEYRIILKNISPAELTQKNLQLGSSVLGAASDGASFGGPVVGDGNGDPVAAAVRGIEWFGTAADETQAGGAGWDFLAGGAGDDRLMGLGGRDVLNGQAGADMLFGGRGGDELYVSGGDILTGGAGGDRFKILSHAGFSEITDPGGAVIRDFGAGDVIEFIGFDLSFAAADLGLEDGFQLREVARGVMMTMVDGEGDRMNVLLRGVDLADLTEDRFIF